ncbi:MAG TPA: hydrogenase maturation protease [Thermoplasmata archaeon]|nr:hydrogenase maturation protease [Thermoplasmata archaeon]
MDDSTPDPFADALSRHLAGATRIAILGIGDDLNPRDRPGILAALLVHELGVPNVTVFLTGTMPENYTGALRGLRPSHVVLIDAAEMGEAPGSVGLIHPARVRGQRFSTHAMPLTLVIEYLEGELGARVLLIGVQPDATPAIAPVESELSAAVMGGLYDLRRAFGRAVRGMW